MVLNYARWLSAQWAAAERPQMTGPEWDNLVKKVAVGEGGYT